MLPEKKSLDQTYSIILLDSDILIRTAIKALITTIDGFEVIAETDNVDDALALTEELRPKIALIEIVLPAKSGLEYILEVKRRKLPTAVAALSQLHHYDAVSNAMIAGAKAFIPKCGKPTELFAALKVMAETDETYLPIEYLKMTSTRKARAKQAHNPTAGPLSCLSNREIEVFYLLAIGLQNTAIAKKLFISPRTVETHRARIVRKLGVTSYGELIRFAIKHGLTII